MGIVGMVRGPRYQGRGMGSLLVTILLRLLCVFVVGPSGLPGAVEDTSHGERVLSTDPKD